MNLNEMRNLSREVYGKRIRHSSKGMEDEKSRVIEMAKKQAAEKKVLYWKEAKIKSARNSAASHSSFGRMATIASGSAIASFALWFILSGVEVKQKTVAVEAVEKTKLSDFAGSVIHACEKGGDVSFKSKWCCCGSRQIMENGCRRMESFCRTGNPEIREMSYDARTSCYLVRYVNQANESVTMKIACMRKGEFTLVGIH